MLDTKDLKQSLLKASKWLLLIVGLVLTIAITTTVGLLGTASGRYWSVTNGIAWLNNNSGFKKAGLQIQLKGFKSDKISKYYIADLKLYKDNAIWLHATEFSTNFSLKKLWYKEIAIASLKADKIHYHHVAGVGESETSEPKPSGNSALYLPSVVLKEIQVKSLIIEGLIPESMVPSSSSVSSLHYAVEGSGSYSPDTGINIDLEANAVSSKQPDLVLSVKSEKPSFAELVMSIQEDPDGWLGYWLRVPGAQAVAVSLKADLELSSDTYCLNILELKFPVADTQVNAKSIVTFTVNQPSNRSRIWHLTASEGLIEVGDSEHSFNADVSPESLQAHFLLDRLPLGIAKPWLPKLNEGHLSGAVNLSNTIDNPNFTAEVKSQVTYDDQSFALGAVGSGDLNLVTIETLDGHYGDANINASGTIDLVEDNNDIAFKAKNLSTSMLESFDVDMPPEFKVNISSAQGEIKGALQLPTASFTAEGDGRYKDQTFTINSDVKVAGEVVHLNDLSVQLSEGLSKVHGDLNWKTLESDIFVNLNDIPLKIVELAGITLPDTFAAKASADLRAVGLIDQMSIKGELNMVGKLEETPFDITAKGSLLGSNGEISKLSVTSADKTLFSGNGSYEEGTYKAEFVANEIPLEILRAFTPSIPGGIFSSNIYLNGTSNEVSLNGDVSYATNVFGYAESGNKELVPLEIYNQLNTVDSVLTIDTKLSADDSYRGTISSRIPISRYLQYLLDDSATDQEVPLELQTDANIDLQVASIILDQDINQLEGIAKAKLDVSGSVATPSINGTVTTSNVNYFNSLTGTRINDLNCQLVAEHQTFKIESCNATDKEKGSYSVAGKFTLPGDIKNGAVDATIEIKNANIVRRTDIESQASGGISISGDFAELLAKGNIEVAPFEAIIDMNVGSSAPELEVTEIYPEAEQGDNNRDNQSSGPIINLDVAITASQQAFLRGRGLEAELSGDINLSGTAANPEYNGEFNTIRGKLELFGKEFDIEQGQVSFVNNATAIAIDAKYEEDDNEITAKVSGQNDEYEISFSSAPSMAEDEILSFIIFGESAANLDSLKAIQLAFAVKKLQGGGGSFDVMGNARDFLNVDSISIENESGDDDTEGGLSVGVGKYLNDRTYLELERTPDPSEPWKGNIEIELTPRIFLETTTGGTSGLDSAEIIWQKDY